MDQLESPKGLNIHPKVHKAAQDHKDCRTRLPWRSFKSRVRPRPSQRPRWARGRPAGLAVTTVKKSQLPTYSRRGSEPLSERRWTRCGIPRPAGLGEAGRHHMEAPQAGVWRGSQAQLYYLLSTDATYSNRQNRPWEGYKRRHHPSLQHTTL